jgi:hypothetical protein
VPACANYGDLAGDLKTVLSRVKDGVPTTVVDPLSGKPFVIHESNVIGAVAFALGGPAALLPGVLSGLLDPSGDDAFASLTLGLGDPTWTNNGAISFGLVCQDVGLIMPGTGGTDKVFAGEGTGPLCAGVKGVPKVVTPLVAPTSDVPVLIGRGEWSGMSSMERLTSVVKPLSQAQIVPVANVGSVSSAGDCWQGIVTAFLAGPTAALDTTCAAAVPLPEFK